VTDSLFYIPNKTKSEARPSAPVVVQQRAEEKPVDNTKSEDTELLDSLLALNLDETKPKQTTTQPSSTGKDEDLESWLDSVI
jgi:hypothetical protein